MKPYLSIIIPCYNEEENLKRGVLKEVHDFLKKKKFSWEVLISDDGSTDNSCKLVASQTKSWQGFKLLKNPHGSKPSTLKYGLKKVKGEYVLFADMDQSTPISELDKLLPHVKHGESVVIGSRGLTRKNFPFYRRIGAVAFSTFRRLLILSSISDTQCGFKLFKTEAIKKAFPRLEFFKTKQRTKGWKVTSYDVELLQILKKMNLKIKEVVVKWHDEDVSQSKGGNLSKYIRESREMFLQILRVKLNDLRGLY